MLSPSDVATSTLRTYLEEQTTVGQYAAEILEGWCEQDGDIDYTVVGLDASIVGSRRVAQPIVVSQTDAATVAQPTLVNAVVQVSELEIPIRVNIWAKSHQTRSQVAGALYEALSGNVLDTGSKLTLQASASDYFSACIQYKQVSSIRNTDSVGTAGRREFRAELEILAEMAELKQIQVPLLKTLNLDWTLIELSGSFSPDYERQVVFSPS